MAPRATTAEVLGENDDLGKASSAGVLGAGLLTALALLVVADVMAGRLAHVNVGRTLQM